VTIAVVGIAEISQTDLSAFRTRYGLAPNPITMTLVPGTGAAAGDNGSGLEAVLDTEWSGAIAPAATINYVYTGASDANVEEAVYYAIEENLGAVLSESWTSCEGGYTPGDADILETFGTAANALGMTYLAASGDDGAAGCAGEGGLYVNMPAAFPGVTGVGGTGFAIPGGLTFNSAGNVTGNGTEAVWNEFHDAYTGNGVAAGGGGISSVFARPTYQSGVQTCTSVGSLPTSVTPSSMRQVPDVALTAASGSSQYGYFIECTLDTKTEDCTATGTNPIVIELGGTSASTPSFAGVIALANQATGGRLGNVNPFLYTLNTTTPSAFHDITTGNNEVTCKSGVDPGCPAGQLYGYAATTGYDCASGLGSIDATSLVNEWATGCSPLTVCPVGDNCGTISNGCRGTLNCGSCTTPQTCGGAGTPNVCGCTPLAACPVGDNCGTIPNGCGGTVNCGSCTTPQTCGGAGAPNVCGCTPLTACPVGDNCGTIPNGCGGTVNCGSCTTPQTCGGAGAPNVCGCTPLTACPVGDNCGTVPNGCGGTVNCGSCTTPQTCGGAGTPNVCGCTPLTACPVGDNCGTIPNGCGGTVNCGSCTTPQTCGGAGTLNACGCTPLTACPVEDDCGTIPDGCGGTVNCGSCTTPQTCGGAGTPNACGCTPLTACPVGDNCGTIPDGCGGTVSCGSCITPQTCGAGTPNVCGCIPLTACPVGDNCGTIPDGCGGTVNCEPGCTSGQACSSNQCVATLIDSGTGGTDSGAGLDSGSETRVDSGTERTDASTTTDSGTKADSDAATDSGTGDSAAIATKDSGARDPSIDGGGPEVGSPSVGCGCRTAKPASTAKPALTSFGVLFVLAGVRLRRRRQSSPRTARRGRSASHDRLVR
jgi:hypothetical protein